MHLRSFGFPLAAVLMSSLTASSIAALTPIKPTLLPVTVTLAANNVTVPQGAAIILTATVTPTSAPPATGEQNPTGSVVFLNGATVLGQATLSPLPVNNSSTATFTIQNLPGGQDSISAYYEGDTVFSPGASNTLALSIQAFTIAPAAGNPATNLDIVQGGSGSESFIVTGLGGYNAQVQVICLVALQDDMTCTPSPQLVTPAGTVTFAVQTYTTGGPLYAAALRAKQPGPLWPRAVGGASLAALVFFLLPFGCRARNFLRQGTRHFLVLLLLLAGLACAGTGCTSSAVLAPYGTPLGVATLTVTATAYVDNAVTSQSVYFTVNVQPQ